MNNILEVCCGSYYDALQAYEGKATRIELNSALHLGGLTPSIGSLIQTKKNTNLSVICMVRSRGAGFCYGEEDIESIFLDAKLFLENDADGIAFGFLNEDKTINVELTKKMVALIHSFEKEAVFHRAVDIVSDYEKAFEDMIHCGVDRVLTSGTRGKASEGIKYIKLMQEKYSDKIEILAGCGINADNVQYILNNTGVNQVHSSCKDFLYDVTTSNFGVDFSYSETNKYGIVDKEKVAQLIELIK